MPRTVFFKLATKGCPPMVLVRPGYQGSVVRWHLGLRVECELWAGAGKGAGTSGPLIHSSAPPGTKQSRAGPRSSGRLR